MVRIYNLFCFFCRFRALAYATLDKHCEHFFVFNADMFINDVII